MLQPEKLTITKVVLNSPRLAGIKQAHRNWLFFLGHVFNELMILNKWVLWSDSHLEYGDVRTKGAAAQLGFLLRLLLGKQLEAGDVLVKSYFCGPVRREVDSRLSADALDAERRLEDYFENRKDTIHYWVRNHFAFHYSLKEIGDNVVSSKKAEELAFYLCREGGNTLYDMSEVVVNRAMLGGIEGDVTAALERTVEEVTDVNRWFLVFIDGFVNAVVGRVLKTFDVDKNSFDISCARHEDICIPWFAKPPNPGS